MVAALRAVAEGAEPSEIARCAHTLGGYVAMWKMVDQWVFLTYYTTMKGILFAAAGERELAREAFEDSLEIGVRTQMRFYDTETLRHLAGVTDDPARRVELLREAIALADRQHTALFGLRAATDLFQETSDDAPLRAALARFPADATYGLLDQARSLIG
jgi:hypothetical protein